MANLSDYFEIVSVRGNVLTIKLKGFWSDDVIEEYGPAIQVAYTEAVVSLGDKRFILVADWSESPVFGDKAKEHLAESMRIFKEHNGYKVIEIVPRALVRIGLKQAAEQSGEDNFRVVVANDAEACEALEQLLPDL